MAQTKTPFQNIPLPYKILPILVTIAILIFLFYKISTHEVLNLIQHLPLATWVDATTLLFAIFGLIALRWQYILKILNINISFKESLLIIIGTWPLGAISPSKTGDFLRGIGMRHKTSAMLVAGSVVAERIIDLLVLCVLALVGVIFSSHKSILFIAVPLMIILAFLSLSCAMSFWNLKHHPYLKRIQKIFDALDLLAKNPQSWAFLIVLTIIKWAVLFIQIKILFSGVGAHVPLEFILMAFPLTILVSLVPITIAGMGTRDGTMILLFSSVASSSQALSVGLLFAFFGYWLPSLIGLPLMKKALNLS